MKLHYLIGPLPRRLFDCRKNSGRTCGGGFFICPTTPRSLEEVTHQLPLHEFSYDAVTYTLWPLNARQNAACHHALAAIDHCDLVDGHHRAEAVIHYSNQTGNSSNTQLLTLLVPAEQIQSESFFGRCLNSHQKSLWRPYPVWEAYNHFQNN